MSRPDGFTYETRKSGEVVIRHHGTTAVTLRGDRAKTFLERADGSSEESQQDLMARATGNYKRGNERR